VLAEFNAGLVEGVDIEQLAHEGGLEFQELQKGAQVHGVQLAEGERAVGPAGLGERGRGGAALDIDELGQGLAAQVIEGLQVQTGLGDLAGAGGFLDRPESDTLSLGPST